MLPDEFVSFVSLPIGRRVRTKSQLWYLRTGEERFFIHQMPNEIVSNPMRKLIVFNNVTLDGYFTGADGDMSWAYSGSDDPEFNAFVAGNASGGGQLLLGRITYDLMAGYWPTPIAIKNAPVVAEGMNSMRKVVFSRTLDKAQWNNTRL